jgi:hypothetical protein
MKRILNGVHIGSLLRLGMGDYPVAQDQLMSKRSTGSRKRQNESWHNENQSLGPTLGSHLACLFVSVDPKAGLMLTAVARPNAPIKSVTRRVPAIPAGIGRSNEPYPFAKNRYDFAVCLQP